MPENVIVVEEDRNFIQKAKMKIENLRKKYQEEYVDTGKSQELERKIERDAEKSKKAIKIIGTIATLILAICPADGPVGEIASALATPGLCALVDVAANIKKKALITGKRGIEKHFLKVDGSDGNIASYDLTSGEIIEDFKGFMREFNNISAGMKK